MKKCTLALLLLVTQITPAFGSVSEEQSCQTMVNAYLFALTMAVNNEVETTHDANKEIEEIKSRRKAGDKECEIYQSLSKLQSTFMALDKVKFN